jgi:hypothetical protein
MEILQKFSKKSGLAVLVGGVGPSGKALGRPARGNLRPFDWIETGSGFIF